MSDAPSIHDRAAQALTGLAVATWMFGDPFGAHPHALVQADTERIVETLHAAGLRVVDADQRDELKEALLWEWVACRGWHACDNLLDTDSPGMIPCEQCAAEADLWDAANAEVDRLLDMDGGPHE